MLISSVQRRLRPAFVVGLGLIVSMPLAASSAHAEITFAQIMANPDDPELNLAYARQKVASGELQQAAAALERLLLSRPNWDAARLFYGIVLYRLDDKIGARRELEALEGRGLNAAQEADRQKHLALLKRQSKSVRMTYKSSLGMRYDTNPGRVSDTVAATTAANDDDDYAFASASRFRLERDIDNGRGDYLFFQANLVNRQFFEVNRADSISGSGKIGGRFHFRNGSITPFANMSSLWLQEEKLRTTTGGGAELALTLSSKVALMLRGQGIYEDYHTTSYSTIGNRRDGWQYSGGVKLRWRPQDSLTITTGYSYRDKDADFDGFSFDESALWITGQKLFGKGRYLTLSARGVHTEYEQVDNFYSNTVAREDDRIRLRAAAGAPLATLFSGVELPLFMRDIVAEAGVTYSSQESNIGQLDIKNTTVDLTFHKRFNF